MQSLSSSNFVGLVITSVSLLMFLDLLITVDGLRLPRSAQMVPEDIDRDEEIEEIKASILKSLGMTRIPDMSKVNASSEHLQKMMKMFKRSIEYSREQEEEDEENSPKSHQVKYFYSISSEHSKASSDGGEQWTMRFDVAATNVRRKPSTVTNANLKIYKRMGNPDCDRRVFVNVYQILSSPKSSDNETDDVYDETMLVSSKRISDDDGWESFDLLQTVRMWWRDHRSNNGLRLVCKNCNRCGVKFGVDDETSDRRRNRFDDDDDKRPHLDLYANEVRNRQLIRDKRSWLTKKIRGRRRRRRNNADCTTGKSSSKCCRYHLWVSFKEIGWDSWIVSPEGFDAYYCTGKCPGKFKPANTHTLVQTAMRKKTNVHLPKPCCVPKKLTPLSLYHYDDSDPPELVLTTHKGMIVKSCACS
ncbi:GDF15 (predicted) [Pycnogonum litorale]